MLETFTQNSPPLLCRYIVLYDAEAATEGGQLEKTKLGPANSPHVKYSETFLKRLRVPCRKPPKTGSACKFFLSQILNLHTMGVSDAEYAGLNRTRLSVVAVSRIFGWNRYKSTYLLKATAGVIFDTETKSAPPNIIFQDGLQVELTKKKFLIGFLFVNLLPLQNSDMGPFEGLPPTLNLILHHLQTPCMTGKIWEKNWAGISIRVPSTAKKQNFTPVHPCFIK